MIPVKKEWTNIVMGEGQDHVLDCPAHRDDNGDVTVAWEMTDEELDAIKKHKTIMFLQQTGGRPMQPIQIWVQDENGVGIEDDRIPRS